MYIYIYIYVCFMYIYIYICVYIYICIYIYRLGRRFGTRRNASLRNAVKRVALENGCVPK